MCVCVYVSVSVCVCVCVCECMFARPPSHTAVGRNFSAFLTWPIVSKSVEHEALSPSHHLTTTPTNQSETPPLPVTPAAVAPDKCDGRRGVGCSAKFRSVDIADLL